MPSCAAMFNSNSTENRLLIQLKQHERTGLGKKRKEKGEREKENGEEDNGRGQGVDSLAGKTGKKKR